MNPELTSYQFNYRRDRMFLVTRDNAWIPMHFFQYTEHFIIMIKRSFRLPSQLLAFVKEEIIEVSENENSLIEYDEFDVTYGDFGHDPYNHIGRRMRT